MTKNPQVVIPRGAPLPNLKIQFILNAGGIGDYILWTIAIIWAIKKHKHLSGHVIAPPHFIELAKLWFKEVGDRFSVIPQPVAGLPFINHLPTAHPNALGFHLIDCGFMYFANEPVPEGLKMPLIEGDETNTLHLLQDDNPYGVVCVGGTAPNRTISAEAVNGIAAHLIKKGLTPVFLGMEKGDQKYGANIKDGINWDNGINLVNKTSILEAACILANAEIAVGIDGGLLHLAACAENTKIVMGMTVASPKKRMPLIEESRISFVVPKLDCIFCQEKYRFVAGHHFKYCLYDDYKCVSKLTAEAFIEKIEELI